MSSKGEGKKVAYGSPSNYQKISSRPVLPDDRLSESFSKKDRLLRRADFVRVQSRGRKVYTKSLLMLVLENRIGRTRLGIAVSKKIGNSVKRNKWKRMIREIFRKNGSLFPTTVDVVIIPKRIPYMITYTMLLEEIKHISLRH